MYIQYYWLRTLEKSSDYRLKQLVAVKAVDLIEENSNTRIERSVIMKKALIFSHIAVDPLHCYVFLEK
ncbi:MAG: hypothetical protein EA348_09015 [Pseudomonadaceae bacterium]|nr:MAG: hypothetical protein EA348_09015 [Pseudomonadaceae bacterium]